MKGKAHLRLVSLQPTWSRIRHRLCLWWRNEGKFINLSYFRAAFSKDILLCP